MIRMSDDWRRTKEIFGDALDMPAERISTFLDSACAGDPELRARVEGLLASDSGAGEFLGAPTAPGGPSASTFIPTSAPLNGAGEGPGQRIGPYTLLSIVGEGGFGIVYAAEQHQPLHRRVALKVIKLGMDTRQVIARFEQERQALALMDHPSIAKVFDGGATPTGRPYFAMEFIKGVPITEYCDTAKLDTSERLALFEQVCQAVQHAHQKGIIHRDLKPTNVLVTLQDGKPVPKIIDFGIAKATAARLTEKTIFTEERQFVGTPEYMSPEQANLNGLDIDTRSDVYSLGVLLYELLTGATPFDPKQLRSAAFGEIQRIIREVNPPKPSARLSTLENLANVAACRQTDPRRLGATVRGDLDWIVMKCLEKDRSRRYESASSLAADVHRHVLGEAVAAAPPSAIYRSTKFVRRHRVGVVATVALAATLIGGAIATTWQAVRAMRAESHAMILAGKEAAQRRIAETNEAKAIAEAAKSQQIAAFIQQMLSSVDPQFAQGKDTVLLRKILDDTAERIETELAGQPEVEAAIRETIGATYQALGQFVLAQPHLEIALDTRRRVLGDDHPDTLSSINKMGFLTEEQGKPAEAERYYRQALEGRRRVLGADHRDTLVSICSMGTILQSQGKVAEAEPYYREALEGRRRVLGDDHRDALASIGNMGFLLQSQGRLAEAEPYYRAAMEGFRRVLGERHPQTLLAVGNMGGLLQYQGKLTEAEPYFRAALEGHRRVYGDTHPDTLRAVNNMGTILQSQGKFAEAEPYYREALEGRRTHLGGDHPDTFISINNMGFLLQYQGRLAEAEPYYREALDGFRRLLGADHPNTLEAMSNMGALLQSLGKLSEAEPYCREVMERRRLLLGGDHADTLRSINILGFVLQNHGRLTEAEQYYLEALEGRRRVLGEDHPDTLVSINNMGSLLREQGRLDEAESYGRQAVERARGALPEGHVFRGVFLFQLGRTLAQLERREEAEAALLEAHQIVSSALGAGHERTMKVIGALVALYDAWGKTERAADWRAKPPGTHEGPPID